MHTEQCVAIWSSYLFYPVGFARLVEESGGAVISDAAFEYIKITIRCAARELVRGGASVLCDESEGDHIDMPLLGIYPPSAENIAPEKRLAMVKEAGFDFVCLGIKAASQGDPNAITPMMCEKAGLECDNVHLTCNGSHALWAPGEEGDAIVARLCREIELASSWGVRVGIVHTTWGIKPPPPLSDIGLTRFEAITKCAEEHRFTVAVENSAFLAYLHPVLEHLQSPFVGYTFDSGHHHAFANGEDLLGRYGTRLCATHIHDNDGVIDLHLMAFDGNADWEYVTRGLANTPFGSARITSEAKGVHTQKYPDMTAEQIAERLSGIALAKEPELMKIEDGIVTFYPGFSYEQMLERQYKALRRVSDMIEAVNA